MRDRPVPSVSFPTQLFGGATLTRVGRNVRVEIPRWSLTRGEYDTSEIWRLAFHIPPDQKNGWREVFGPAGPRNSREISFEGHTDDGRRIVLRDWRLAHVSEREPDGPVNVDGVVLAFDLTDTSLPDALKVNVREIIIHLTPTPLASRGHESVYAQLRRIPAAGNYRRTLADPFLVELSTGVLMLGRRPTFNRIDAAGDEALVVFELPTLAGSVNTASFETPAAALIDGLKDELLDLCRVLSLLSRQRVDWTNVVVTSIDRSTGRHEIVHRRRRATRGHRASRPLIYEDAPPPDGISIMLAHFGRLPYKQNVRSIIGLLISVLEPDSWIETKVMNAFTAMEALANSIYESRGETLLMDDTTFGEFRDALKPAIARFASDRGWDADIRKALYAQLRGLQRPPIVDRLASLFQEHGIEWRDRWKDNDALVAHLRAAYARRSDLIHAGKIADYSQAISDYENIHALTERLLYKLLGGQDNWVDSQAYTYV